MNLARTIEAWSKVSSRTVAYECSKEHIHNLIADALHDISRLAKEVDLWKDRYESANQAINALYQESENH